MFYAARGNIPPKRHTQHRAPDGSLYAEELFGVEGFTGRSSLLYHLTPPTQTHRIEAAGAEIRLEEADDGYHHHRLIDAAGVEPRGDAVTGRIPLFFNNDIVMGVVRPAEPMPEAVFYRNGEADELLYVHEGAGLLDTVFGPIRYGPGDYLVLPIGTTWRLVPNAGKHAADALPRMPLGDRGRRSATATTTASSSSTRPTPSVTSGCPTRSRHGPTRATSGSTSRSAAGSRRTTTVITRSTWSAGTATSGRSRSTSATSSRSPGASTSRRPSTRRSRRATSWCARSCRASSTTTRWRSRRRTTTRTSTATRSSTTSPATS